MLLATWQDFAAIAVVLVVAYLLVMWLVALVWTYRDIRARTRDQMLQVVSVLLVLVFNLPGLLIYLILRPSTTLAENYDRRLESEAILRELGEQPSCHACRRRISEDFVACPFCRTPLRMPCGNCGRPLASEWVMCPHCAAERLPAVAPRPHRPVPLPPADPDATDALSSAPPRRPRRPSTATYTPPAPQPQPAEQAALDVGAGPSPDLPPAV